ncbi:hypothetical protein QTN47_12890 [Danxiaibacter flavus]|uniref:Lipoprotein n=1 Tax=Danxiaibacter flavus TaxID=3049108 RepID=A0ABV3ZEU9_9BACT|nr:hypothetical protein QNM32_12895 [Chitinophagaceae bacterium DXS]
MKKIVAVATLLVLFSCNSKNTPEEGAKIINNDSTVFYPIRQFFTEDKKDVDSTPYFLYRIAEKDGRRDSTPISKRTFDSLASMFTAFDINDTSVKKYYEENVFNDLTTNSITLSYRSINKRLPVQSIDVLLNNESQRVKRIFVSKLSNKGDTVIIDKMGWKANESFYINRLIQLPGGKEQSEKNTVIWNKKN